MITFDYSNALSFIGGQEAVDRMDAWDMIDAWLEWNGIIGYTHELLMIIEASEYFGRIKVNR